MEDHCPMSLRRARVPWASTEKSTGWGTLQVMGRAAGLFQVAWDGKSSLDEGLNLCAHRSPGCTRRTVAIRPPPQGGTGQLRRTISPRAQRCPPVPRPLSRTLGWKAPGGILWAPPAAGFSCYLVTWILRWKEGHAWMLMLEFQLDIPSWSIENLLIVLVLGLLLQSTQTGQLKQQKHIVSWLSGLQSQI